MKKNLFIALLFSFVLNGVANAEIVNTTLSGSSLSSLNTTHNSYNSNTLTGYWFTDNGSPLYLIGGTFADGIAGNSAGPWTLAAALSSTWKGTASNLADSPLTSIQQSQLQSLLDHVYYSKAYSENIYSPGTITQDVYYAGMLSHAVSFILYGGLNANGTITDSTAVGYWGQLNSDARNVLNSWLTASATNEWDGLDGYNYIATDIVNYNISNKSFLGTTNTSLFAVTRTVPGGPLDPSDPSATPEPATMLIMGLGVLGLAVSSRRIRRK